MADKEQERLGHRLAELPPLDCLVSRRIGLRHIFAVEFELAGRPGEPASWWNNRSTALWLWVRGEAIGDTSGLEAMWVALLPLERALTQDREAASAIVLSWTPQEVMDGALWAKDWCLYEEHSIKPKPRAPHAKAKALASQSIRVLPSLFILAGNDNLTFQGWVAILIETSDKERFVFRRPCPCRITSPKAIAKLHEILWFDIPIGTFNKVVSAAQFEMEELAKSLQRAAFAGKSDGIM